MTNMVPVDHSDDERVFQGVVAFVERYRDQFALGSPHLRGVLQKLLHEECVSPSGMLKVSETLKVIDNARKGDGFSAEVLEGVFLDILKTGKPVPPFLAAYFAEARNSPPPKQRGKKKIDYHQRNDFIAWLVEELADFLGIHPTRNRDSKRSPPRESACSIVSRALNETKVAPIGEKAVEAIYLGVRAEKRAWGVLK